MIWTQARLTSDRTLYPLIAVLLQFRLADGGYIGKLLQKIDVDGHSGGPSTQKGYI